MGRLTSTHFNVEIQLFEQPGRLRPTSLTLEVKVFDLTGKTATATIDLPVKFVSSCSQVHEIRCCSPAQCELSTVHHLSSVQSFTHQTLWVPKTLQYLECRLSNHKSSSIAKILMSRFGFGCLDDANAYDNHTLHSRM